jgi:predicted dehydrogenase
MTGRPRIAVLGAGVMGGYHTRVVAQSERCDLARVVDPDSVAGLRLADRYATEWRPEVDTLSDLDAVVIAAPTHAHPQLVAEALGAGLPVLVEKPATADLGQTEELVSIAERRQIPLMCGFVERFNPAILTVTPMLTRPLHVTSVRHSPYSNRIRVGVAWDQLIHDVDACLRIMNDHPVGVGASLGTFHPDSSGGGGEDVAEAVLTFASGAVASTSASRIGQRKIRSITIGELGRSIEIDLLRRDVTIYRHVSHDSPEQDGIGYRQQTVIEIPELISAREPLAAQLDHFLDLVDGRVDLKEERDSILPAHRVIANVVALAP